YVGRFDRRSATGAGGASPTMMLLSSECGAPTTSTPSSGRIALAARSSAYSAADISQIANTYRRWHARALDYAAEDGFSRSVPIQEVIGNSYNLLSAAYVSRGQLHASGGGPQLDPLSKAQLD